MYGFVGGYGGVNGNIIFDIDTDRIPVWELHAGITAEIGFLAKVWGFTILDYDLPVLGFDTLLAQGLFNFNKGYRYLSNMNIPTNIIDWSPDGEKILLTGAWDKDLVVIDTLGNIIVDPIFNSDQASWLPDSKSIVFHSTGLVNNQIFITNLFSGDNYYSNKLTNDSKDNSYPTPSPDGTKIAFISQENYQSEIFVIDSDGSNLEQITDMPEIAQMEDLQWSPNGKMLAFSGNTTQWNIYTVLLEDKTVTKITESENAVNGWPAFSPDNHQILYTSLETNPGSHRKLMICNADGTNNREFIKNTINNYGYGFAGWSPDGKSVALVITDEHNRHGAWIFDLSENE